MLIKEKINFSTQSSKLHIKQMLERKEPENTTLDHKKHVAEAGHVLVHPGNLLGQRQNSLDSIEQKLQAIT